MNFMNSLGSGITLIVAIPFLIIALLLLRAGLRGRRLAAASKTWPSTTGKVLSSEVEARRSSSSHGGYTTSYYPVIFYEYQVDGQIQRSNTLVLGGEIGGAVSRAQQKVMAYPPGSSVQVFYNPANPQQATLEQGRSLSGILVWVAVLIIVGLVCTLAFSAGMMGMASSLVSGFVK
jgi:hypothetical protein